MLNQVKSFSQRKIVTAMTRAGDDEDTEVLWLSVVLGVRAVSLSLSSTNQLNTSPVSPTCQRRPPTYQDVISPLQISTQDSGQRSLSHLEAWLLAHSDLNLA